MKAFGLNAEQLAYARNLAEQAAYGAWAKPLSAKSRAYLKGALESADEQRSLLTELLRLAAFDPDQEWEAPTLTGYPTAFAVAAHNAISG